MKDRWELMRELNCIEIDDDEETVENDENISFVQSDPDVKFDFEEESEGNDKVKTVVQASTLCATIVAMICEIMNLIEVIVNYIVSYSMFTLSFSIIGVFATVYYVTKIKEDKKLLICGIICLALAFVFAILWMLSLFKVIK
ncbi:MAG: hypothetical protein ACI4MB_06210 [Candidatus Coproplasma sp.]